MLYYNKEVRVNSKQLLIHKEEMPNYPHRRTFKSDASEAAFLLGGIGTGNVSIGARGELRDWEIFNRPAKGNYLPYTFFAIWVKAENDKAVAKILESKLQPPYSESGHGFSFLRVGGLPRLDSSTMRGEYPFVYIDFEDKNLPVKASLEAFTPFIPLNANDSGIPAAIIRYKITNNTNSLVRVSIAGSLSNPIGFDSDDSKNDYREENDIKGLYYHSPQLAPSHLKYGNMAMMTTAKQVNIKNWIEGMFADRIQDFWDDFSSDGILEKKSSTVPTKLMPSKKRTALSLKVSSLVICHDLLPGETKQFEFFLTWYFPNRVQSWDEDSYSDQSNPPIVRNYYGKLFTDAWGVGEYLIENIQKLEKGSRDFSSALYNTTVPDFVIDAIASNITVIRSPTCFRLENGTFLGYEGCDDTKGSCPGNCTHVWNYAQSMAFLFPELEQSMRITDFDLETNNQGEMAFRAFSVFGDKSKQKIFKFPPAADGQLGSIIRLYREWKLSGNSKLLKKLWAKANKALDFAFGYWDKDGDFVLDGEQHNTYDIEFHGPNSLTNSLFFAALKAGIEMAKFLGDHEHSTKYQEALEKGSKKMDEILWNGEYYIQKIDDVNEYRHQYGTGCLSDQLFGQLLAHVVGLGYILPEKHVKKAIESIYKYNFRTEFANYDAVGRTYVLPDEKGLLMCSWPKGNKPKIPFGFSSEVWTGTEYQVAAHLIYEGLINEGLTIIKAVRERHDGYRRNPWNEMECGHHYVRSMSSWAILLALSGFRYDMVKERVSFKPVINQEDFLTFWSTGKAWGVYTQKKNMQTGLYEKSLEVLYGKADDIHLVDIPST